MPVATALCVYEVARRNWMKDIHGQSPSPPIRRPKLNCLLMQLLWLNNLFRLRTACCPEQPEAPVEKALNIGFDLDLENPSQSDAARRSIRNI